MIFAHLTERFGPDQLMVSCLYTRRGGLDINPIRASHSSLIPQFFTDPEFTIRKTLRQ
jgi:7-cyano-7-deazaguanine reductase